MIVGKNEDLLDPVVLELEQILRIEDENSSPAPENCDLEWFVVQKDVVGPSSNRCGGRPNSEALPHSFSLV
jgi:hypothetical protein